jgi:hypothetical protein
MTDRGHPIQRTFRRFSPYLGEVFRTPQPPVLYHYTNREGFLGIMNTRELWASNLRFLNDSRELQCGLEMISKVLHGNNNPLVKDVLDDNLVDPSDEAAYSVYGVSFSAIGDDLSQWRAYGSGGGYAIGFPCKWGDMSKTLQRFAQQNACFLGQVRYKEDEQRKLAQLLVSEMRTSYRPSDPLAMAAAFGRESGLMIASLMKDRSFEREEEWRLIGPDARPDEIRYRNGRTGITPYIALNLNDEVRAEIVVIVGPCPHQESAIDRVSVSKIPYRDW